MRFRLVTATVCAHATLLGLGCSAPASDPAEATGGSAGSSAVAGGSVSASGGATETPVAGASSGGTAGSAGSNAASSGGGAGGALGGGGAAGADSGEPRPPIANAVLWLEASNAPGLATEAEQVSKWQDASDSHNDATQPTTNLRPTLIAAANGAPARVHFEATRHTFLGVPDAESLRWGTGDFTVALLFAFTNQPLAPGAPNVHLGGWGFALDKITQPSGPRVGWGIMGNWPNGETSPVRSAVGCETTEAGGVVLSKENDYNDGALRLWVMRRVTARSIVELRLNGVVNGSAKGGSFLAGVDTPGTPVTLGGARLNPGNQASANFNLDGDIAAVVAVKGELSDNDLATLEQYLMKKYQVTPP